jgi:hypothetical protein
MKLVKNFPRISIEKATKNLNIAIPKTITKTAPKKANLTPQILIKIQGT